MKKYYVYELVDPRNNKIFYVGKGCGKRMYCHVNEVRSKNNNVDYLSTNIKKFNKINKILNSGFTDIVYNKIFESEDEKQCYKKEIERIEEIGLKNLCNLTNGGDGMGGGVTEKHKNSVRKSNYRRGGWGKDKNVAKKLNWHRKNNDNYGFKNKHHNDSSKQKISQRGVGWSVINSNKKYHEKSIKTLKENGSLKGNKNPMYGRCAYDIWVEKYGKEEADIRKKNQYKRSSKSRMGIKRGKYK